MRCTSCSLVFLNPAYSDEELAAVYPLNYYAYQDEPKVPHWKHVAKKMLGYWHGTKEPRFAEPAVFLDIGCGGGALVERMRELGWHSYGVDINKAATEAGRAKGLRIFCGALQEASYPDAFFDYVRASHSLEHMNRPHEVLEEIRRILKPDGMLLVAVPNIASLPARVFGKYWWHLCAPVHTVSYSRETLTRLLMQHDFHVERLRYNSDYVGTLGSLQIWLNRQNGRRSSDGSVFNNRLLRIVSGWLEKVCDFAGMGDMIEVTSVKSSQIHRPEDECLTSGQSVSLTP